MRGYLGYKSYNSYATAFGCMVWTALASFTLISRSNMGADIVSIMEALVYLVGVIGIKIAFSKIGELKHYIFLDVVIESIFLLALYIAIIYDKSYTGYIIYAVIIINAFSRPIVNEKMRMFEDKKLIHSLYKNVLSKIRKQSNYSELVGGISGAIISVFAISMFKIDIYTFAMYVLIINIIQNGLDYYMWHKYVKQL